ncbi:unnamed protein product, partial [Soboliphyme baturini]|uniref:GDNF domain-containing protein n=1 Tax=Soboliphyme baturini TaxID=241478 RepID=A0A183J9S0_9BILA
MYLRMKNPMLNVIGFPIYAIESEHIEKMCNLVHEIRDKCSAVQRCPGHQVVQFTNALLGFTCGPEQQNFFLHFQCIQDAIRHSPDCVPLVNGAWVPGFHKEVCHNMPQFFRCVHRSVLGECGSDSVNVLVRTIRQFWCDVGRVPQITIANPQMPLEDNILPTVTAVKLMQSVEADNQIEEHQEPTVGSRNDSTKLAAQGDIQKGRSKFLVTIHDKSTDAGNGLEMNEVHRLDRVFKKISKSSDGCSSTKLTRVRAALQPLFKKWLEFHKLRKLENVDFPLYFYNKAELLELCDYYATAFLQCSFTDFQDCAKDDVIFIANGMLGYICSSQHVSTFTENFDCIALVLNNLSQCRKFIT